MLPADEDAIHIFSADADRFVKITRSTIQDGEDGQPYILNPTNADSPGGDILIFRPFATWRMASALLLKAGSELGNTFHGHHDMQLQNDAVRKIMVGHYTVSIYPLHSLKFYFPSCSYTLPINTLNYYSFTVARS